MVSSPPPCRFTHLAVQTPYSVLSGMNTATDLIDYCRRHDVSAIALTDHNNLFAVWTYGLKLAKAGIKPIIGCTLPITIESRDGIIGLLIASETGYQNLCRLLSDFASGDNLARKERGAIYASEDHYAIDGIEALHPYAEGLILRTGGKDSPLQNCDAPDDVTSMLQAMHAVFPQRTYLELFRDSLDADNTPQAGSHAQELSVSDRVENARKMANEATLVRGADALGIPLVATNACVFPHIGKRAAQRALAAIAKRTKHRQELASSDVVGAQYLKSPKQMASFFADLPDAVANTDIVAQRCNFLPESPKEWRIPQSTADNDDSALAVMAEEGLKRRLAHYAETTIYSPVHAEGDYFARLQEELGIIAQCGFSGYFLIVSDFIKWAHDHGIPVGPGRGSGAGSLVAWCLRICDLDPLRWGLLFERFLNVERISMPDFDIDFCQERRGEVINYVREKYGNAYVAQIATLGELKPRAAINDVTRVLEHSHSKGQVLTAEITGATIEESKKVSETLRYAYENDSVTREIIDLAMGIEGMVRNKSIHAAGIVISDAPLTNYLPVFPDDETGMLVCGATMKGVDEAKLIKFDFLGLRTLSIIHECLAFVNQRADSPGLTVETIPLEDERVMHEFRLANTVGVFQFEGQGMQNVLRQMKPTALKDLIVAVALFRPGPMENIEPYCRRHLKEEEYSYDHPILEGVLAETYGIPVFQEQVMRMAQVAAGYSLGAADVLRRAMGKKDPEEMKSQRGGFIAGAKKNGIEAKAANKIFDTM
ncbi:MAG: DNA polymerase III subunit alpha, partial [Alphaproteobacteria bacterium]|nr:DNA polymerase III subunit alpha [Alphaproteobacteria bacterium]